MNNDIKRLTGTLLVSAAVLLAGCSKEDPAPAGGVPVPDLSAPIELSAGIETQSSPLAGTKAGELSGPVTEGTFPANTTKVFSLTAYAGTTEPTNNWSSAYFSNIAVNSGTGMPPDLTLATPQYYPANGNLLYFYAYSPVTDASAGKVPVFTAGNGATKPSVSWTIDGKQDIMAARHTTGIAKSTTDNQTQPDLQFTHKLKQVKFKVVGDASILDENLSVTTVEIMETPTTMKMDLSSGNLSPSGSGTVVAYSNTTGVPLSAAATACGEAMIASGNSFKVQVKTGDIIYPVATVTLSGDGAAGESHEVTLTLKRNAVVPTATVTTWSNGDTGDITIL